MATSDRVLAGRLLALPIRQLRKARVIAKRSEARVELQQRHRGERRDRQQLFQLIQGGLPIPDHGVDESQVRYGVNSEDGITLEWVDLHRPPALSHGI
jgi:hypothetical protein